MSKLYSALLLCEKHSKTIAIIGQSLTSDCQRGGGGNLSVIFQGFITYKPPLLPRIQEATVCPVVPEVASSLNWCGSQSSLPWHVVYWAVLNSFKSMMFDASPVTHIMWKTNLKM